MTKKANTKSSKKKVVPSPIKTDKKSHQEKRDNIFRVHNFQKFYATNIIGGLTDYDFRFEVLNERLEDDEGWASVSDALIILTPRAMKKLFLLLDECIKLYEKQYGVIDTSEKKIEDAKTY